MATPSSRAIHRRRPPRPLRNSQVYEGEMSEGNLKRPPPPPPLEQEEERSKRRIVDRDDSGDEDWLRYSPPPAEVVAEKAISRFASDIQGDCMPVTSPNGEMVYAKLAAEELGELGIGLPFPTQTPTTKGFSQNPFIH